MEGHTLTIYQLGSHVGRNCFTESRKVLAQDTFPFGQMSTVAKELLKCMDLFLKALAEYVCAWR